MIERGFLPLPRAVVASLVVILGIELVLQASGFGLIGTPRWRITTYQNGAFWAGLLRDWQPNYALQPLSMFATYAVLHSGFEHVAGNALSIAALGPRVCERSGQRGYGWIVLAAAIGGGLAFALLNRAPQPMVGASGVVFGLAGAMTAWLWDGRHAHRRRAAIRIAGICGILVLLNALVWISLDGLLAWETHLGGFLSGFAVALVLQGRGQRAS